MAFWKACCWTGTGSPAEVTVADRLWAAAGMFPSARWADPKIRDAIAVVLPADMQGHQVIVC